MRPLYPFLLSPNFNCLLIPLLPACAPVSPESKTWGILQGVRQVRLSLLHRTSSRAIRMPLSAVDKKCPEALSRSFTVPRMLRGLQSRNENKSPDDIVSEGAFPFCRN